MQGKYSFWIKVLSCLVAGLAITSYFIPDAGKGEVWIPLFSGFCDLQGLSGNIIVKAVLGGIFNILICVSLLAVNTKSVNNVFNPGFSVLFFLLVVLLNPEAAYFSALHPAVLMFVWGQYFFITKQKFLAMFLLSLSSLFYAPLFWVLPLVMTISIFGAADIPRVAVKSLGGILLPFVYIISFRYMAFNDALVFIDECIIESKKIVANLVGNLFLIIRFIDRICF